MADFKILTNNRKFIGFNEDEEKSWKGPFYFIQAADCQLGLIKWVALNRSKGHPKSPKEWPEEIALAEETVKIVNALDPPPRFLIICGDLCNAFPDFEPDIRKLQEADFKKIYAKVNPNIPLVCVCGNHDIGDIPTPQTVSEYRSNFGDDYFSFWVGGVFFIVLNSQLYMDWSNTAKLKEEQEKWLDETLAVGKEANARTIVFQHIPLFCGKPDEPFDAYFNISPELSRLLLDKFVAAGVTHVFCGHLHRNGGAFYTNIEVVVTSAIGLQLGSDKSGMRVVKVQPNGVEHSYFALGDFPSTVDI